MIESELNIINKLGLHARAAAKFVSCASRFGSRIQVGKGGEWVDGKSIMSVMMLAAGQGSTLALRVDGDDEAAATEAIHALVNDYFGEGE
ncbi:HPr family phosphocarrier protein [Congregibacter litoralis]|uniref:Phosphotransferase System HPr (HPr) Family n=1 Tax=Congregibacter litoralis KT71 TaxID=314285 RepID=A4A5C0_9GAMM|nr:HPr family phosphocarrier protein [Congregibacter litoralis]EAQ98991.1 Phosphotransferase System HPr (HPr) Family [Congregibacter litoralis KT71]